MAAIKNLAILMATLKEAAGVYAAQSQRYDVAYNTLRAAGVDSPEDSTTAATLSDDLALTYAELLAASDAKWKAWGVLHAAEQQIAKAING